MEPMQMQNDDDQLPNYQGLRWVDGRWHCDGEPIHAGCAMELLVAGGRWLPVRIESRGAGRWLRCYFTADHIFRIVWVDLLASDLLRWPREGADTITIRVGVA